MLRLWPSCEVTSTGYALRTLSTNPKLTRRGCSRPCIVGKQGETIAKGSQPQQEGGSTCDMLISLIQYSRCACPVVRFIFQFTKVIYVPEIAISFPSTKLVLVRPYEHPNNSNSHVSRSAKRNCRFIRRSQEIFYR